MEINVVTYEVTVKATIRVPDEYVDHPNHGIESIASDYAFMAVSYRSVSALKSEVINIAKVD